jgi:hypothetical protein
MRNARSGGASSAAEGKPAVIWHASPTDFQRDLGRYWRHVRKVKGLPLTREGRIYKSAFKALCHALNLADPPPDEQHVPRLKFMRALLEALQALHLSKDAHHLVANPDSTWFSLPLAQRIARTFEAWRDLFVWNEIGVAMSQLQSGPVLFNYGSLLLRGRQALLRAIRQAVAADTNRWIAPAALTPHSGYLLQDTRRTSLGVQDTKFWKELDLAFVISAVSGPLHWMGLVELGYPRAPVQEGEPPSAFRLTSAGAWLLADGAQPEFAESGGRLIVQPNFTLLALEPISDAVLSDIDHFAELQSDDRAVTYRLTREALYRGQQAGWDAARVIAFLEAHQGGPLPANVRRSLEEWEAAHRRITIHRSASVVQLADAATEAALEPVLAPFGSQSIGPRFHLLSGDALDAARALREAGWPPLIQTETETGQSLRIDDDGQVTFSQPTPSLDVLGQLARFAEILIRPDGSLGARLTEKSVRAAVSTGLSIEQLFQTLEALHDGPLPDALRARLNMWGSFYGSASFEQAVLLRVADHRVLDNLLRDPKIGRFLRAVEGSSQPIALLNPIHLDVVRGRLCELGIDVHDQGAGA